ncbi:iron complex outermembrane receptor protein [Lewinella marina]|uniref:SusC/RagA family TonB-linked outer membrane protein n=1 Tax=Neolewinella marina TaxID=438751 RepID=A0A2G0CE91_9BACT|nr:TonB-dependent receptor [Neolewinella marina]NJB87399.1 iron complex outermembrane receptor protein [Neolewinella marina]PHK98289.1 SusC/RagA family TonB-linked outer membrane protein [Neolewinella marina]
MKTQLLLYALLFSAYATVQAQTMVTGTVTDSDNQPLTGVTVSIPASGAGTVTDIDGRFSLPAEIGDVLRFSYIGMQSREVEVEGDAPLDIVMEEDATQLDEVVVVGYGTSKRSDVTGSIASVSDKDFNKGVVVNPGQLLQGKVAGVNVTAASGEPGATQDIIIRGVGSLRSGTTPLFVVDGFALDNSANGVPTNPLNFINPADIESIDVLKDASAAAIYGARAANGVIVITTKKGRAGQSQINASASTAVTSLARQIDVFSADEFRSEIRAINGILNDGGANTNWQDALTRTANTHRVNLSLSGGAGSGSYFASFSAEDQEGLLRNNDLQRYSGRLNLTQRALNDRLNVALNFSATRFNNRRANSNSVVTDMLQLNPTFPSQTDGELPDLVGDNINPLVRERIYTDASLNNRILANIAPSLEIIDGLTYRFSIGVDYSVTNRDVQFMPYPSIADFDLGSLDSYNTTNSNTQTENTLTYEWDRGAHDVSLLAGHTYQQIEVSRKGFFTAGFPNNGVEPRYQVGAASEPTRQSASATINELQSFFGRVNYGFDDKYLITLTMRADGSSKFGANNKYGYFPSVALGWNLTNEDFLSSSEVLTMLKLRGSWGRTGNQEIPAKITQASFTESNSGNDTYPLDPNATDLSGYPYGSIYTRLANPDIQWEVSTQTNVGLDFALFNYRLTGNLDVFNKVSENILLEVAPVDPIQPVDKFWTNIPNMEIQNTGVELALNYSSDESRAFVYGIGGNISVTGNEVRNSPYSILTTGAVIGAGQTGATVNGVLNGEPIGTFFVQDFLGIGEDGLNEFADLNGDGEILDNDRFAAGTALPTYIYAMNFDFAYRNFDLGINFNGVGGNKIFNHVALSIFNKGNLANSLNTTDLAVQYPNEDVSNSNRVSTRYLEDGDFLRLNNATLGYNFDLDRLGIGQAVSNLRLSITGQNLLLFTDYSGFDPEINTGNSIGDIQTFGIDYFSYPRGRTFLFSVDVTF